MYRRLKAIVPPSIFVKQNQRGKRCVERENAFYARYVLQRYRYSFEKRDRLRDEKRDRGGREARFASVRRGKKESAFVLSKSVEWAFSVMSSRPERTNRGRKLRRKSNPERYRGSVRVSRRNRRERERYG